MKQPNLRRAVFTALAPLALLAACGGAPILEVTSDPTNATIYVNGQRQGQAPVKVILPFDQGERVWVQAVHPDGLQAGEQTYTEDTLPSDGRYHFRLR
ncbi:MAG: PEGA domain-containing protein [Planctomycetes bacterium]|nr:PEGA domain-containing protein [Planctomycetota bacterium]